MQFGYAATHTAPLKRHVLKYAAQFAALGLAIVSVQALGAHLEPSTKVHILPLVSVRFAQFTAAPPVAYASYNAQLTP